MQGSQQISKDAVIHRVGCLLAIVRAVGTPDRDVPAEQLLVDDVEGHTVHACVQVAVHLRALLCGRVLSRCTPCDLASSQSTGTVNAGSSVQLIDDPSQQQTSIQNKP